MISTNSFIYTNTGIYKIDDLYKITKAKEAGESIDSFPFAMSFDEENRLYKFTQNYTIKKYPEEYDQPDMNINLFYQMFECRFTDIVTNRIITMDCTEDTYILQYNILKTDTTPIDKTNYGVLRYLKANKDKRKLGLGWKKLSNLLNYSTYMPNICLGDTITKFINKEIRNREVGYVVYETDDFGEVIGTLPIFICQDVSNFYNFILVKSSSPIG